MTGKAADCLKLQLGPWRAFRASCLHALGRTAEESALVDSLESYVARDGVTWLNAMGMSVYYASTGQAVTWAKWFEQGVALSPEVYFTQVIDSGLYDPIRNDPLFEPTLARARDTIRKRFAAEFARLTIADALR